MPFALSWRIFRVFLMNVVLMDGGVVVFGGLCVRWCCLMMMALFVLMWFVC